MKDAVQTPQRYRGHLLTPQGQQKLRVQLEQLESQTALRQGPTRIAERVQLHTSEGIHAATVRKILRGTIGVDKRSIKRMFEALGLSLLEDDCVHANLYRVEPITVCSDTPSAGESQTGESQIVAVTSGALCSDPPLPSQPLRDWGNAVEVSEFCDRTDAIQLLSTQIIEKQAQVVTLLGIAGVGKTTLAIKVAQTISDHFDCVIWRSLRYAPSLEELLKTILPSLMQTAELPTSLSALMALLLKQLKQRRCLLVLDQGDAILQAHQLTGTYQTGYEPYGAFFKSLMEVPHLSSLVLTSRESPRELHCLDHPHLFVHTLAGLGVATSQRHFDHHRYFDNHPADWAAFHHYYGGNPLALKLTVAQINDFFDGNRAESLRALKAGEFLLRPFQAAIADQLSRLTPEEHKVLVSLVESGSETPNGMSLAQIKKAIPAPEMRRQLLALLDSLLARSLIETQKALFHTPRFRAHATIYQYLKVQQADCSEGVSYLKVA